MGASEQLWVAFEQDSGEHYSHRRWGIIDKRADDPQATFIALPAHRAAEAPRTPKAQRAQRRRQQRGQPWGDQLAAIRWANEVNRHGSGALDGLQAPASEASPTNKRRFWRRDKENA